MHAETFARPRANPCGTRSARGVTRTATVVEAGRGRTVATTGLEKTRAAVQKAVDENRQFRAALADLSAVPGVSSALAQQIYDAMWRPDYPRIELTWS